MSIADFMSITTYGVCLGFGAATVLFILSSMLGVLLGFLRKY